MRILERVTYMLCLFSCEHRLLVIVQYLLLHICFFVHLTAFCFPQTVVVDARGHMLGRLASIVAKQCLNGQHVVSSIRSFMYIPARLVSGDPDRERSV
jgi:hypothetical protein